MGRYISNPMLVKPKCVWEVKIYFHFSAFCLQFFFKINFQLPNIFWLYQHRVRNAYFQSYSQNEFQILIWVTMYYHNICYLKWATGTMHQTAFGTTRFGTGRFSVPAMPAAMIYRCVISFTAMPSMLRAWIDIENRIVSGKSPRIRRR